MESLVEGGDDDVIGGKTGAGRKVGLISSLLTGLFFSLMGN